MSPPDDPPKRVSAPIRMSPELLQKVAEAARRMDMAQADVLRLALSAGLEDLRRIDYDLPRLISDAARGPRISPMAGGDDASKRSAVGI